MMLRDPSVCILLLLASGCASVRHTPSARGDFPTRCVLQTDFDAAWAEVIEWFEMNGLPLATVDKSQGMVASGRTVANERLVDIGEISVGGLVRWSVTRSLTVKAGVRSLAAAQTEVEVKVEGQFAVSGVDFGSSARKKFERDGTSTGVVEADLLGYLQRPRATINSRTVDLPFEDAWSRVVSWFARNTITIDKIERGSGLITAKHAVNVGDDLVIVGPTAVRDLLRPVIQPQAVLNVFLRRLDGGRTEVTVNLRGQFVAEGVDASRPRDGETAKVSRRCASTGKLEWSLMQFVAGK